MKIKHIRLPRWANILISVIFPMILAFAVELGHMQSFSSFFSFAKNGLGVLVFDIFLIGAIFIVLSMLIRKVWISSAICSIVFFVFSCIEYYKYNISGSHFLISDLALTKNVGDVALFADLKFNAPLMFIGIFLGIYALAMWFFDISITMNNPMRYAASLGVFAVALMALLTPYFNTLCMALGVDSEYTKNTFQENERFSNNSLTANLAVNVSQMIHSKPQRPDDYNQDVVDALMQGGNFNSGTYRPDINVVVVMNESFADFREFLAECNDTTTLPEGTYDVYDEILAQSDYGICVVPTFGGGTVRTEFELIFGLPMEAQGNPSVLMSIFEKNKEYSSIPSLYKANGYSTAYMHPFSANFYDRVDYYDGFGFDKLLFDEDMSAYLTDELMRIERSQGIEPSGYYHNFISDASVYNEALTRMKYTDTPDYIHITTMQNHMPYGEGLQEETNYFAGIKNSSEALRDFIAALDELDEKTIVLFMGDHYPYFSDPKSVYHRLGIDADNCDMLYQEKYLIWNNAGIEFETQPLISAFYLPCIIADKIGMGDSFNSAILSQKEICPIYSPVIATEGTQTLKLLTYDRINGSNYSD